MTIQTHKTSELLRKLKAHEGEHITVEEILSGFEAAGFAMLIIIFAIPVALPVPAVGYGTVMAIPMLLLCIQLLLGYDYPKLPKKIAQKKISMVFFGKVVDKAVPLLTKVEWFLKPRLSWLSKGLGERLVGLLCVICSLSVMLPIPLTNTIPAMGVVAMMIGLLERDGLAIIGGVLIGCIGMAISLSLLYALVFLGAEGMEQMEQTIRGLF